MGLKALGKNDVTIRPFKVHKSQTTTYVSGSGTFAEMNVATARRFPLTETFLSGSVLSGPDSGSSIILTQSFLEINDFDVNTADQNEDGTFQEPLFGTVEQTFYVSGAESGSATFAAAGSGIRDFPLSESAYVVNVAQRLWGEGIRRGSFQITTPAAGSGTIEDDGTGRLFVSGAGGSLNVVGNVFYNLGVAVINRIQGASGSELIQESGMFFPEAATLKVNFEASLLLFEYSIIATMEPGEFNYSNNPSALGRTGIGSTLEGPGPKIQDLIGSGTLSPFVTTIGLYNDRQQLVAVAKVPRPIKRLVNSQQSFIIRFDV